MTSGHGSIFLSFFLFLLPFPSSFFPSFFFSPSSFLSSSLLHLSFIFPSSFLLLPYSSPQSWQIDIVDSSLFHCCSELRESAVEPPDLYRLSRGLRKHPIPQEGFVRLRCDDSLYQYSCTYTIHCSFSICPIDLTFETLHSVVNLVICTVSTFADSQ